MKKQLLLAGIAMLVGASANASSLTELRTKVKNNTKGDAWATWYSATMPGKAASSVTHGAGIKEHRYLQIPAGKDYTMAHTGDELRAYMYPCKGVYSKYKTTLKGYQRMDVDMVNGAIVVTPSIYSDRKGVTKKDNPQEENNTELRTHVYNNTPGDIWVTWKSASTAGKIITTPFHWAREHRFVRIKSGHSYAMIHTGDKLSIYSYPCKAKEAKIQTNLKGYKRVDVDVEKGEVVFTQSLNSGKKGSQNK